MATLLSNKVDYCPKCKRFVEYDKEDVKRGEEVYYVYGCEENWAEYKYINCPKCGKEIKLKLVNSLKPVKNTRKK